MSVVLCDNEELQNKIKKGVNKLADYVASTLGPSGRNVIIQRNGRTPFITKDGVTVANNFELEDPVENAAALIIKQVANQTNNMAGDGTTTSTVLAREIYNQSLKYLNSGVNLKPFIDGMHVATDHVIDELRKNSKSIRKIEDVEHVATISANNDREIGKLIANAIDQAGANGAISIEEARSHQTSLEVIEGFTIDSGFVSNQFITDERRGLCRFEDCLILVTDHKLEFVEPMLPVLELTARENKPLIIVADDIEGQFLAALIMNALRGSMKVVAIKSPRYGEERRSILEDLSVATGATFFKRESGKQFKEFKLADFGRCKTAEITKITSTFVGGKGDHQKLDERIEWLEELIENTEEVADCEKIQERITRLSSGVAIIRVGAATQVEMIEKKHRVEDALEAVKAAQSSGIHVGGGMALVRAYQALKTPDMDANGKLGYEVVCEAMLAPFKTLADNSGMSADVCLAKMLENENEEDGFDFLNGEVRNLLEGGIVDPVRVTCSAVKNSVSAVSTLITSNHSIVEGKNVG
jgi:chaperonin GroEL